MKTDVWGKSASQKKKHSDSKTELQWTRRRNLLWRSVYFVGSVAFLSGCLYQSCAFLQLYFEYPTTMEVNVEQMPVLKFPAVTLCNGNRVRQDLWCSLDPAVCNKTSNETREEYIVRLQDSYKWLNRSMRIFLGHTMNNFIRSCLFEDEPCDDRIGQYFNYEYTNCFTVNARWANRRAEPLSAQMFRPRTGRSSELSLMLNLESERYSPMTPVVKARMTIHAANAIPNPQYDGVSLQPGQTHNYGVKRNVVHVLPHPYITNCKNYTGLKDERTGSQLTQEGCMSECCAKLHEKYCTCTVHRLSLIYDIRTCWKDEEQECLIAHDQIAKDRCYLECRMPCTKLTFGYTSVDSFTLSQGACYDADMFNRTLSENERKNYLCLKVFYATAESEIYRHRPKYNGIQVFSIIGGYIGLWLGVSLLDLHGYFMNLLHMCLLNKEKKFLS